jgi:hypothetical protein
MVVVALDNNNNNNQNNTTNGNSVTFFDFNQYDATGAECPTDVWHNNDLTEAGCFGTAMGTGGYIQQCIQLNKPIIGMKTNMKKEERIL